MSSVEKQQQQQEEEEEEECVIDLTRLDVEALKNDLVIRGLPVTPGTLRVDMIGALQEHLVEWERAEVDYRDDVVEEVHALEANVTATADDKVEHEAVTIVEKVPASYIESTLQTAAAVCVTQGLISTRVDSEPLRNGSRSPQFSSVGVISGNFWRKFLVNFWHRPLAPSSSYPVSPRSRGSWRERGG